MREMMSPDTAGYFLKCMSDPTGFARFHSNFRRFSFFNDSGKMKKPYSQFNKESVAAAKKGARTPKRATSPPIKGPMINPKPKAAPIIPKFCALFSGGL